MEVIGHDHILVKPDTQEMMLDFLQALGSDLPPAVWRTGFSEKMPHFMAAYGDKVVVRSRVIIVFQPWTLADGKATAVFRFIHGVVSFSFLLPQFYGMGIRHLPLPRKGMAEGGWDTALIVAAQSREAGGGVMTPPYSWGLL